MPNTLSVFAFCSFKNNETVKINILKPIFQMLTQSLRYLLKNQDRLNRVPAPKPHSCILKTMQHTRDMSLLGGITKHILKDIDVG